MKITLITQYYKPEMGAPQNRLYEMCRGLKENGADVSIITGLPNYPTGIIFPEYKGKLSMKEEIDGIEVRRYWLYASNSRKAIPRIWNMITFSIMVLFSLRYLRKRRNDFIIVESPPLTLGESGLILSRLTGAGLVLNVSDLWPLTAKELGAVKGNSIVYKILESLEHHLYKNSVLCTGQSQEIVDYIKDHGAKDTYLFRNGVDPERFASIDTSKRKETRDKLILVYAGLLGFAQSVSEICRNVNFKDAGAEFHIYGAGGDQAALEEYLAENPDCGVYYHGKVSREQIPAVLSEADCTLIPLIKNILGAVPSKIYESMACGLPILFSGDGEGKRIVEDNKLGWISSPRDYKQLEATIRHIASAREEWDEKRQNCLECARTKFNRPKQVKALYDYLESKLPAC